MRINNVCGKRIWGTVLVLCLTLSMFITTVFADEKYKPEKPRWTGYGNQVQWEKPKKASSSDNFEYEVQLLLDGEVIESQTVQITTYTFFSSEAVVLPQENYTIRVRARWMMIVGDPDGQYMVVEVADWGPWATTHASASSDTVSTKTSKDDSGNTILWITLAISVGFGGIVLVTIGLIIKRRKKVKVKKNKKRKRDK